MHVASLLYFAITASPSHRKLLNSSLALSLSVFKILMVSKSRTVTEATVEQCVIFSYMGFSKAYLYNYFTTKMNLVAFHYFSCD